VKLQKAVRDFESILIQQMLKSMRSSINDSGGLLGDDSSSLGGDTMTSMFDMELSKKNVRG